MEIRCCTRTVWQYSRENPALNRGRSSVWVCPARDMSSVAPCLHEEVDTIMLAHAMEAAKRAKTKINSHTVGTDVVVLVMHVVQQLRVEELCVCKNRWPSLVWYQILLLLFYSLTGCDKTSSLIGRGKRCASFPAVTEYFVKMNFLPEKPPADYLCTIERFIIILYGRTSKHLHEHRHG